MSNRRVHILLFSIGLGVQLGCATAPSRIPVPLPTEPTDSRTSEAADIRAVLGDFEWPGGSRFRSAGRIRALGQLDEGGIAPELEKRRLRRHFEAVLAWLAQREPDALEVAIDRLELQSGKVMTASQREDARNALQRARAEQMATLDAYAQRGVFPLHPEAGADSEPIFVDANGTACAVGHLMREDGWSDAVERIRETNNDVFLPDVESGPVLAWVATSGLLIEEAAVIQPTYSPPPGNVDLSALATAGGSASAGGIQIEGFMATRKTVELTGGLGRFDVESLDLARTYEQNLASLGRLGIFEESSTTEILSPIDLANIQLTVSSGGYTDGNGGLILPAFPSSPWTFWNAGPAGGFLDVPAGSQAWVELALAFDVHAATPGFGIDATTFGIDPEFFWGGTGSSGSDLRLQMEVRDPTGQLLSLTSFGGPGGGTCCNRGQLSTFAPQESLSVVVRGLADAGSPTASRWGQFRSDFRIVPIPEPGTGMLLAVGIGLLAWCRRTI